MKINQSAIKQFIDLEPLLILSFFVLSCWLFYKHFLGNLSPERHFNIQKQIKQIFTIYIYTVVFFIIYSFIQKVEIFIPAFARIEHYLGITTIVIGTITLIRSSRLLLLEYLFLSNMRTGVPLLIVNIFSLLLSFTTIIWALAHFFDVNVTPILATSAALSIVLGLALQDTLGNLFAAISLSLDRSFEIGDWIEVVQSQNKTVGQVTEISWRSTTLSGWGNEVITFPNRVLANAQINNYKKGEITIYRSQTFRVPHHVDVDLIKKTLLDSIFDIPNIRHDLPINCFIIENHESWLGIRISYPLDDFGKQYDVAHAVIEKGLKALQNIGINPSYPKLELNNAHPETIQAKSNNDLEI